MGYILPFNGIIKKGGGARKNGGYKAQHRCGWELFSFHFSGSFSPYWLIPKLLLILKHDLKNNW